MFLQPPPVPAMAFCHADPAVNVNTINSVTSFRLNCLPSKRIRVPHAHETPCARMRPVSILIPEALFKVTYANPASPGNLEKLPSRQFFAVRTENAVSTSLHFQSLTRLKMAGPPCPARAPRIFRGALHARQVFFSTGTTEGHPELSWRNKVGAEGVLNKVELIADNWIINPATKYVALSASNRARVKARLAGNGKPLSKAATPRRALFEASN